MSIKLAINGRFLTQPTTGVQRVAREITREIDNIVSEGSADFHVRLVCQRGVSFTDLNLKSIQVEERGMLPGHIWEQVVLPSALRGETLLCLGNTAPIACLVRRQPVAVLVHDLSYRIFPGAYRARYRVGHSLILPLILRHARPIITVSRFEERMLAKLAVKAPGKIVIAQNGGWRDPPSDAEESATETVTVGQLSGYGLYVGSFSQRKNISGLLAAMIRLAREDDMRFVLVGSAGAIMSPISLDLPSDVLGRISFLGHVESAKRLAGLYAGARCLVFPSFYEASPLPPIEAMHFGCPVIASHIASMRERCGEAAEYCDPESVESIVAAVRRVIGNPTREAELVTAGREWAKRYSWRKQARIVLDAIANAQTLREGSATAE